MNLIKNRIVRITIALTTLMPMILQISSAEQRVDHLYEARVPIAARDNLSQQAAMTQGLAVVLNKISGYSGTADFPELADTLSNARNMVSEFGLQSMEVPSADQLSTETTDALYMRFVSTQVDQSIRQFEIPVWPANRADILYLVAIELGGAPHLLTAETHPAIFAQLRRLAFDRGFGLFILNQDSLDSMSISPETIWALDPATLKAAFATLPVDAISVVRLSSGTSSLRDTFVATRELRLTASKEITFGDLSLFGSALEFQSEIEGTNFTDALNNSLHEHLDHLSLKTAFVASGVADTKIMLEIEGIPDFESFRRVRSYIQSLEQIENMKLLRLGTEKVVLQLEFQSGLELLHSSLINSGLLVSLDSNVSGLSDLDQLVYRFSPPLFPQ